MSDDLVRVKQSVKSVEGLADQFVNLTGGRIDQVNEALNHDTYTFEIILQLRIVKIEATLIRSLAIVYQQATFHTLRAYWHASPALMLILAAIWAAIQFIYNIVKWIISIVQIIQALKLDDLLAYYWPAFNDAREKFRRWVDRLSMAIGWGADGLLHLLHATQGFTDILGGLSGKSFDWMQAEWMVKSGNILKQVSNYADQIQENPGKVLEILFQTEMRGSFNMSSDFGEKLLDDVEMGLARAGWALNSLSDVSNELAAIRENMPEVIRENIPPGIFDSLEQFSDVISTQIMPRLTTLERNLGILDNIFDSHSGRLSELANKLAHPGTNLLTIDDLPDYAREGEEGAIDDVASRMFGASADADRAAMESDLAAFAIIDAAVTAPLPPPEFMTIETPERAALYGITATPQETWFVGGYKSPF